MSNGYIVRNLLGLVLLTFSSMLAYAQVPGSQALPPAAVAAFLADPGGLLTAPANVNGGPGLSAQVRNLLTSDQATLTALIGLLKTANEDQRKAIAIGLAEAARAYARTNPGEATQIQQAVAKTGMGDVVLAYANAGGDTATASVGGGGGGSGSGGPTGSAGSSGGGGGFAAPFGTNFATNGSGNLLTGGSVGGGGVAGQVTTH